MLDDLMQAFGTIKAITAVCWEMVCRRLLEEVVRSIVVRHRHLEGFEPSSLICVSFLGGERMTVGEDIEIVCQPEKAKQGEERKREANQRTLWAIAVG